MESFQKTLFLFRRDYRLEDNTGLLEALKNSKEVIPAFIFTEEQIDKNPYRSNHSLQFLIESLEDLIGSLKERKKKLFLFYGKVIEVLEKLHEEVAFDAIFLNKDYTPYSKKRDGEMAAFCKKKKLAFLSFDDALLHPPEKTVKKNGKPYTIFTPFYRNAKTFRVALPQKNDFVNYYAGKISCAEDASLFTKILPKRKSIQKGGRKECLKILESLKNFEDYAQARDFPAQEGTTHLSPHLKFTTCSLREVYHAFKKRWGSECDLIREIFWRDFFTGIAYFFPHVFGQAFQEKYDKLTWSSDPELLSLWKEGMTGFPIVDAGMRELKETGFMHNRVRMITASFLVKDLHIDWREGEKHFARLLIDYDPAVNNGNWQWAASTGCDAQPYFRIFNPWSQSQKFDPEAKYIKRWIPELVAISPAAIHQVDGDRGVEYPSPIIDHSIESKKTLAAYQNL